METLLADLISGDETLAETAMNKLIAQGEKSLPALANLLDSSNPDHRWWAISTAAQIDAVDVDWLLAALDDEALEVQQSAALGLAAHPCPKAVPALINSLCSPDAMLVTLATNALIAVGTDAVSALLNLFQDPKTRNTARLGAIRALAEIADTRAIPVFMTALEEDSALIHHWAETGLEKLGLDMVYMKLV